MRAHISIWLSILALTERQHQPESEHAHLSEISTKALDYACALAGADTDEAADDLWAKATDAFGETSGACRECGEHWKEMRRDGESTRSAGSWSQTIESRTCGCGRTFSSTVRESDVQILSAEMVAA